MYMHFYCYLTGGSAYLLDRESEWCYSVNKKQWFRQDLIKDTSWAYELNSSKSPFLSSCAHPYPSSVALRGELISNKHIDKSLKYYWSLRKSHENKCFLILLEENNVFFSRQSLTNPFFTFHTQQSSYAFRSTKKIYLHVLLLQKIPLSLLTLISTWFYNLLCKTSRLTKATTFNFCPRECGCMVITQCLLLHKGIRTIFYGRWIPTGVFLLCLRKKIKMKTCLPNSIGREKLFGFCMSEEKKEKKRTRNTKQCVIPYTLGYREVINAQWMKKEFTDTRMKNKGFYLIFVKIMWEEIKKDCD